MGLARVPDSHIAVVLTWALRAEGVQHVVHLFCCAYEQCKGGRAQFVVGELILPVKGQWCVFGG